MQIKVMTFNLLYDKPRAESNIWQDRCQAISAIISVYKPDIIGTQECKPNQLLDLLKLLPEYHSVGGDRTGTGADEHCAIFYRHQQFKCLSTGDFYLSETPEIPGSITSEWGNNLPRMATWAVLATQLGNITVFNTHLDYKSKQSRELSAKLICDRINNIVNIEKSFILLTGDFNANPDENTRQIFSKFTLNNVQIIDALAQVNLNNQMTFHYFSGTAFAAIDTIYYDSRLHLDEVKIENQQWQGIWPSDHFPVVAYLTFMQNFSKNI